MCWHYVRAELNDVVLIYLLHLKWVTHLGNVGSTMDIIQFDYASEILENKVTSHTNPVADAVSEKENMLHR